ncbi:MAG: hypothetical protein CMM15_15095 [Rhodospirillaceae bacterium]|nr:hypothetical protein [Rhodospirillaceae bacterium]
MFDHIYKSPMVWGENAWMFLHCVTYTYPNEPSLEQQKQYKTFMTSLQHVLPCPTCRRHYREYLLEHSIEPSLVSQKKFVQYVLRLHNHINTNIKQKQSQTLEQCKNLFENRCIQQYLRDSS